MGRGAPCQPIGGSGVGLSIEAILPGLRIGLPPIQGSQLLGNIQAPILSQGGGGPPRFAPNFNVLGFGPKDRIVREIYVEETCGFELPLAKIVLNNVHKSLSSTILAKEQSEFKVMFGYRNPGMQNHGTYIVQRPKFRYMSGQSPLTVEITGYGEAVKLGATERREVYSKMRDSHIAQQIASRNGFSADVETTEPVHAQVIQANESDYKFLARRAKMYGYFLYVEDGVMHFHRPRPRESGVRLTYLEKGKHNVNDFVVHSRTFMRGLKLKFSQIDPLTKEEYDIESSEESDPLQAMMEHQNWKDLVSIPGVGQPERFITNEGHEQFRPEMKRQIDRMAQSTRYVIAGVGTSRGMEAIHAKDFITVEGVGRSSGRYFVTRAIHQINSGDGGLGGGYKVRFEVVRVGAGELSGTGTTVVPQSAGSVAL